MLNRCQSYDLYSLTGDDAYKLLNQHVKSFIPNAKDLDRTEYDDEDDEGEYGSSDQINHVVDDSLLSRFHLPYFSENPEEEESNLRNIQKLLVSLDRQQETTSIDDVDGDDHHQFNIESYILDCTSLEQIFMALLYVSNEIGVDVSFEHATIFKII